MSTTTNGKPKAFALNAKRDGVEVRVGGGELPRITLTKSDLAEASSLLGCYFSTSCESVLDFINRARAAEREMETANKSLHATLDELGRARAKADDWKATAERNLADWKALKADLAEVALARDEAQAEAKNLRGTANVTVAMLEESLRRVKLSRLVVGLLAVAACIATVAAFGGAR